MEHTNNNFFESTQLFNNENSFNIDLRHDGLKNLNKIYYSKNKLSLINRLMQNGEITEALSLAEQELKKDNNNSNLYNAIGAILYNNNQKEEAEKKFQKALILDNKNAHAFSNIGKIYLDKQDIISALKCFKRAFSLDTKSKVFFTNLNNLLLEFCSKDFNDLFLESYELIMSDKLYQNEIAILSLQKLFEAHPYP